MRLPAFGRVYGLGKQTSGINADAMTPCPRWVARTGTSSSAAKEESRAARKEARVAREEPRATRKECTEFRACTTKKATVVDQI